MTTCRRLPARLGGARRRRPWRSRSADAARRCRGWQPPTWCSTTRSSTPTSSSSPGKAQRIYVGKRAGRPAMRQTLINQLLVRAARRGQRVVRLKGGDPFVFGRGGEEALALVAAGHPVRSRAGHHVRRSPRAALAGIPVTHRGSAAAFVVVSGPRAGGVRTGARIARAALDDRRGADGAGRRPASIAALLIGRGWRPATPAAIVRGASTAGAETWMRHARRARARRRSRVTSDRPGTIVDRRSGPVGAMLGGLQISSRGAGRRVGRRSGLAARSGSGDEVPR